MESKDTIEFGFGDQSQEQKDADMALMLRQKEKMKKAKERQQELLKDPDARQEYDPSTRKRDAAEAKRQQARDDREYMAEIGVYNYSSGSGGGSKGGKGGGKKRW